MAARSILPSVSWSGLFIFPCLCYDGGMASVKSKKKEKGISPVWEQNRGRRNREFDFEKHLAPIHGDNPDDWVMIYNHSYFYILDNWENRKAFAPEGGSRDDEEGANSTELDNEIGSLAQLDDADRETCLQDAFVLLIYRQPVFTTLGQARAWVAYTAANLAGTEYKNRKKGTLEAIDPYFSEEGYRDRSTQAHDEVLNELDEKQLRDRERNNKRGNKRGRQAARDS